MPKYRPKDYGSQQADQCRDTVNNLIALDVHKKKNPQGNFRPEKNLFRKGYEWASAGNKLYDAPIELIGFDIKNASDIDLKRSKFVAGYNNCLRYIYACGYNQAKSDDGFEIDSEEDFLSDINVDMVIKMMHPSDPRRINFLKGYNGYYNDRTKNDFAFFDGVKAYSDGIDKGDIPDDKKYKGPYMFGYEQAKIDGYHFDGDMDIVMYLLGIKWADDGNVLDDAPENYRYNPSFIDAYNEEVNNLKMFELGEKWAREKKSLNSAPLKYQNSSYFVDGFKNYISRGIRH